MLKADHRVRRAVAEGLGRFAEGNIGEKAVRLLIELLENDISFLVRASAASSLSSYKLNLKALTALKRVLSQDSYNDVVRSSAFKSLSELGDAESLQSMIDYFKNGKRHRGRIAAAHGVAKLGKNNAHAVEELFSAQSFPDARVRMEAASAIEETGFGADLERLRGWLAVEPEGRVRRRIREAIYSIETWSVAQRA